MSAYPHGSINLLAWPLWFFMALPLLLLDGVGRAALGPFHVDLTLALCHWLVRDARTRALPVLLLCASLARATVLGGEVAYHALTLGLPVAGFLPLRGALLRAPFAAQALLAGALAVALPRLGAFLQRFGESGAGPGDLRVAAVLWAAVTVPLAARLMRRLPPLSLLEERRAP
jgi:hypothetical protein